MSYQHQGLDYIKETDVQAVRQTDAPYSGRTQTGYGGKIPNDWELRIGGRWYRVYTMIYSNSGSSYVIVGKKRLFLGTFDPRYHANQLGVVKKAVPKRRWR